MEWCWSIVRNDWITVERGFCVGMPGISIFSSETRFHSTKDVAVLGSAAVITLLYQGPTSFNGLISKYRSACRPTQSPFPPDFSRTKFSFGLHLASLRTGAHLTTAGRDGKASPLVLSQPWAVFYFAHFPNSDIVVYLAEHVVSQDKKEPAGITCWLFWSNIIDYGRSPRPPSKVKVSPVIYLKSGCAN